MELIKEEEAHKTGQVYDRVYDQLNDSLSDQLRSQVKANPNSSVIEELKSISNNYQVLNGQYVISKNVLDVFIQHLESHQNALLNKIVK